MIYWIWYCTVHVYDVVQFCDSVVFLAKAAKCRFFLNCLLIFVMSLEIQFNYQELGKGGLETLSWLNPGTCFWLSPATTLITIGTRCDHLVSLI